MPRVAQAVRGHGLEHPFLSHTVENPIAHIRLMRLHQVGRALGKVERHRPVVGNGVDNILHTRVQRRLRRPYMRSDDGNILWNILKHRRHQLGSLLVARIVGELPEALVVERFPQQLVEEPALLRKARAEGVEVVLRADNLCTGGVGVGVQIHPVGRAAKRVGG